MSDANDCNIVVKFYWLNTMILQYLGYSSEELGVWNGNKLFNVIS